jgi:hypothetical protein
MCSHCGSTAEEDRNHQLLLHSLSPNVSASNLDQMETRINRYLALPREAKEAGLGALFTELAAFTANALGPAHG